MANTSRRALLSALAAAPALVAPLVLAAPSHGATGGAMVDRSAWDTAMHRLEQARAAEQADDKAFWPIHDRWYLARPKAEEIDWKNWPGSPFLSRSDKGHAAFCADLDEVAHQYLAGEGKWWWAGPDRDEVVGKHLAAIDRVREFRSRVAAHDAAFDIDRLSERNEALGQSRWEALQEVLKTPAPDLPALLWKLEYYLEDEGSGSTTPWVMEAVEPLLADARRLLGQSSV